jgi:hypothetical protein
MAALIPPEGSHSVQVIIGVDTHQEAHVAVAITDS